MKKRTRASSASRSKTPAKAKPDDASSSEHASYLTASERRRFQAGLLKWYDRNGRQLPWRSSSDPYRVWLSEIMLQQTTVTAVVPYFERFLAAFPTVKDLAAAHVDQVLRLWEGLGYYSRARNLHRAANVVCDSHGGEFPSDIELLNALPGIGRYTAGAIASFAFNLPAPIVEANTERLYARLMGLTDDVKSSSGQKQLWQFAEQIVSPDRAGDLNQALMDVGSKICTPQKPDCAACPLMKFCRAFQLGQQETIPVRKPRVTITEVDELAVVVHQRGEVLLRRRGSDERWAGMWDFARFELDASEQNAVSELTPLLPKHQHGASGRKTSRSLFEQTSVTLPDTIGARVVDQVGTAPAQIAARMQFKYSVTRYRVILTCLLCDAGKVTRSNRTALPEFVQWFPLSELSDLPLSQTGRRIADWVSKELQK